ncbi:MAG TPA: hypothetical protein DCS05_00425 [Nitrospiraceae bacterium]|nr:hypothetical protein [Nitrospiraceae bacterium]
MSNLAEKIEEQPPTNAALEVYREIITLEIVDQDSCALMVSHVKKMKDAVKGIEAWFKPMMDKAKKVVDEAKHALDGVKSQQTESTAPFVEAATTGQNAINAFLTAERQGAAAEQLRLQEEAAAQRKAEQEELQRSAEALEKSGSTTAAAALRQEAERVVEAPVFVPTVDKTLRVDGGRAAGGATMSQVVTINAQVTDVKAFLKYLVDQGSAATFIDFPKAKLNAWVKANGIKAGEVPGLAIEESVSSRI